MSKGNSRGITLIELLVVLTLIALASGVVGPAVARQFDAISLQSTATQLTASFRQAQAVARATQVPIVMTYASPAHEFQFWKESKLVSTYGLPSSIAPVQQEVAAYVFLPSGQIIGSDSLEFQNQRGRKVRIKTDLLSGIRYE